MPELTISGETELCEGDSVLLSTTPDPTVTYQWLQDGDPIPSAFDADFMPWRQVRMHSRLLQQVDAQQSVNRWMWWCMSCLSTLRKYHRQHVTNQL